MEAGKVTEVNFDAAKQGITGVVEDEASKPVARARVQICPQSQVQQQLQQFVQQRGWGGALTDEQGRFTISGGGQWASDYWRSQKFVAFATRDGYSVAIGTDAFDLPLEGSAGPSLRLVLRSGGFVRGRVEHAGGAPAVGVSVTVAPKQDPTTQGRPMDPGAPPDTRTSQTAYTDFDGRFEVKGIQGVRTSSIIPSKS